VPPKPTAGMRQALSEQFGADPGKLRIVPDAFELDAAARLLTLYEVIVTHEITPQKRSRLLALAAWLGDRGWSLRLMLGDSRGGWIEGDIATGRPNEAAAFAAAEAAFRRFT
jgi:hypothetical protein